MEKRALSGVFVLLLSAITVNCEWLTSSCDLSPWHAFPLLPVMRMKTAQNWPLIMKHDWPVMSLLAGEWWEELADIRHPDIRCPKANDRLQHYPTKKQRYRQPDGRRGCFSLNKDNTGQPVHQPLHHPEQSAQLYKAQTIEKATLEPQRGPPKHQVPLQHHTGSPERQDPLTDHRGSHGHQDSLKQHTEPLQPNYPLKPPRGPHGHQGPLKQQAEPLEHQKVPSFHKHSEQASSQTRQNSRSELKEVLSIPLQGFNPRQLKIVHHGSHIRVSASRTCLSPSDRCVSREMEKTYELPFPIAQGSMKASVDPELNVMVIRGLPTEETKTHPRVQPGAQLTDDTEEIEEEVLAEDDEF